MLNKTLGLVLPLWLLTLSSTTSLGQETTWKSKLKTKLNPDSLVNGHVNLIPIPIFQISPETGVRFGVSMDYFFNATKKDSTYPTRDSFAWIQAAYSLRRQLTIEPAWQIFSPEEKWFFRGRGGYSDFSEKVWGFGTTLLPYLDNSTIFYSRAYLQTAVLKRLAPSIFAGGQIRYNHTYRLRQEPPDAIVLPNEETTVAGGGWMTTFDSRNNPFSPTQGFYLEIGQLFFGSFLGGKYTYQESHLDIRHYRPFSKRHMIAFQGIATLSTGGEIPFRELPRLGGSNMGRGIVEGRSRDRQFLAAQTEYRYTINRFFKAAAFASIGQVFPDWNSLQWKNFQPTGGIGLRILVNEKKQLYSRVDLAFSRTDPPGLYFRLMDAF